MTITENCVVAIFYTLTDEQGQKLDASGDEPLVYLHGSGHLIRGLEQELDGKVVGESFEVSIEPALAYGDVHPQLIKDVPRDLLSNIDNLHVGMALESKTKDGATERFVIDHIGDEKVTINANHPLAGMTLRFQVAIDSVREATQEEMAHGHAH
ncbi:MAG: peptidylprolyl isomerase [Phycisphaerae bacterium]|nr:peptidylprolyl isomerase [Phycisphaerae bacterium]NIP54699.1 peptidylprolyl isomerase [Phycisphaerae bacterium]NIW97012.1 peptidylprolyl isomerase [Phycisphaerae bacterium]NIX30723.1 peptidylprolyl isomerase [Phycisphaerae bacterium]